MPDAFRRRLFFGDLSTSSFPAMDDPSRGHEIRDRDVLFGAPVPRINHLLGDLREEKFLMKNLFAVFLNQELKLSRSQPVELFVGEIEMNSRYRPVLLPDLARSF